MEGGGAAVLGRDPCMEPTIKMPLTWDGNPLYWFVEERE